SERLPGSTTQRRENLSAAWNRPSTRRGEFSTPNDPVAKQGGLGMSLQCLSEQIRTVSGRKSAGPVDNNKSLLRSIRSNPVTPSVGKGVLHGIPYAAFPLGPTVCQACTAPELEPRIS